jgi:hypothetical protein
MEHNGVSILHARLSRVERRIRAIITLWALSLFAMMLLGVLVQRAASQPPVVRARSIEIVDRVGIERLLLSITSDGTPGLRMRDAKGKVRLELSVDSRGRPGLVLADDSGKTRAVFVLLAEEGPTLRMFDAAGKELFRAP